MDIHVDGARSADSRTELQRGEAEVSALLLDRLRQAGAVEPIAPELDGPFSYEQVPLDDSMELASAVGARPVRLSIIMPVYNEARTVYRAIAQVMAVAYPCPMELIVVDDGSDDQTPELLSRIEHPRVRVYRHSHNRGKGAALRSGIAHAEGTHVVPFDADLEYSPGDLLTLLKPVIAGRTDIVYGSRVFGMNTVYQSFRYAMANKVTTLVTNVLFDSYISDLHTCLKLVPVDVLRSLALREDRFGLDTEITARLLKLGYRPFEIPVSYHARSRAQGKKLSWRDGVVCLAILFRVRSERNSQIVAEVHRIDARRVEVPIVPSPSERQARDYA